jgi:ABC-type nitrate/sulfonate/bicarbonate transport system substrate-binding protein
LTNGEHYTGTLGYRPAELKDPEKFKEFVEALRRGHPKCNRDDNLAIQVVADRGLISVTVLSDQFLRELSSEIPSSLKPRVLTALAAIDQFLHAVKQHEDAAAPPCRYDYRLYYRTSDDYHFAREKFERPYFYPERMIPLAR